MVGDGGRADGQLFDGCCGADQLLDGCGCDGAGAELVVLPHALGSGALVEGADWPHDDEAGAGGGWAAVALPFSDGSCVDMAGCDVVSDPPASLPEIKCSMPGSGSAGMSTVPMIRNGRTEASCASSGSRRGIGPNLVLRSQRLKIAEGADPDRSMRRTQPRTVRCAASGCSYGSCNARSMTAPGRP